VLRLWLDRPLPRAVPFFLFTDRVRVLDSISSYHHLEASSAAWARETGGGIFELHSYALPDDLTEPGSVRTQLLEELYLYMPELKPARVLHEYLQVRDDFTAFHTGLHAERPEPRTGIPGLVLAADWVKIPCPAMLMEAAATSALLAANELLEAEGLRQEPVFSVPLRGLFARGSRGPGCRESGFQPQ
jgi:isorenieratene synthase